MWPPLINTDILFLHLFLPTELSSLPDQDMPHCSPAVNVIMALSITSAPRAASAGSASSFGEWLMPSLHGTKTIALGTRSAMLIVSWAAPECIAMYGSPLACAASSSAATTRPSSGVADKV